MQSTQTGQDLFNSPRVDLINQIYCSYVVAFLAGWNESDLSNI